MGTMKDAVYAGMLVMFLEKGRLNETLLRRVSNVVPKHGHISRNMQAALDGDPQQEQWLSRMMAKILGGGEWSLIVNWDPPKDGPVLGGSLVQYVMDIQDPDRLSFDGLACLRVYTITQHMPPVQGPRTGRMVETFKDIVKAVKPQFALLDIHHEVIAKRKGKDPRRFAWGAMYYDAAHTKAIGIESLHNCAAVIKEDWHDGAFWVQTWGNPFIVAPELTDQIALDLGLKRAAFPSPPAKVATTGKPKVAASKRKA